MHFLSTPCAVPSGPPRSIVGVANSPTSVDLTWLPPQPQHTNGIIIGIIRALCVVCCVVCVCVCVLCGVGVCACEETFLLIVKHNRPLKLQIS